MKYAFITGATSGLGKDFARLLVVKGYNLILVGRRKERLYYMESFFYKKYGIKIITFNADISDSSQLIDILNQVKELDVEIVINCAGYGTVTSFYEQKNYDVIKMLNTNILAPHIITKFFSKNMNEGYILNISSIASFSPTPIMAQYGATKSYLTNFSLACSYEAVKSKSNISICVACPGPIKTEFDEVAGSSGNINQMSSMRCAKIILNEMFKGKRLIIPGMSVKLSKILLRLVPYNVLLPIEYLIQKNKMPVT